MALQIGIRSFRVAGLLLAGLLAYDVFWVFGSPDVVGENVMLTVATSPMITGPMRLLFPRALGGVGEVRVALATRCREPMSTSHIPPARIYCLLPTPVGWLAASPLYFLSAACDCTVCHVPWPSVSDLMVCLLCSDCLPLLKTHVSVLCIHHCPTGGRLPLLPAGPG